MNLESVFVSGNHLFILSSTDGKLDLNPIEFASGTMDVFGVKKSYQPDMLIPPNEKFSIEGFGEFIVIKQDTGEISSMIKAVAFDKWVCFYIDTDKKLIVHVQPQSEEYNFTQYEHKPISYKSTKELEQELQEMQEQQRNLLKTLADEIDEIAKHAPQ